MRNNIAEPDKAYDKCHHVLNPFKSNETSYFLSNEPVYFRLQGCWVLFFVPIQILIEHPISKQ